jgi:hypothetical protein
MNRKYSAVAVSALVLCAAGVAATDASAREAPEPQYGNTTPEPNYPTYDPQHHGNMGTPEPNYPEYNYPEYKLDVPTSPPNLAQTSGDDTGVEVLPAGASALGGAGLALAGMWLYRRRHAAAV